MSRPGEEHSGARRRLKAWLAHHCQACGNALRRFTSTLPTSLMTTLVIAIALSLPAIFLVLLDNAQSTTDQWRETRKISAFLSPGATADERDALAERLRRQASVATLRVIPANQSLSEFREHSKLDSALELLESNPLPAVLVVTPHARASATALDRLVTRIEGLPLIERVRLDRDWAQRLAALLELARRGAWIVTGLLGATVALVVGNTIRLELENRREEITIAKLIGASDAFVRRPFLYAGILYGMFGGIIASVIVVIARALLAVPLDRLASLYNSAFQLSGLGLSGAATVLACGVGLAWLGAWAATTRHLETAQPQ